MSTYKARNLHYLRISANSVLPLYLYIDERHISWMSDTILQHVLADLRPLIIPKLRAEADAHIGPGGAANVKKGTVEVHRGDTYQFAFFFRKTEPHSILIKTRDYVTLPIPPPPTPLLPSEVPKKLGKRLRKESSDGPMERKKSKTKGKGKATIDDDIDRIDVDEEIETPTIGPRRSQRSRKQVAGGYQAMQDDDENEDSPDGGGDDDFEMQDDFAEASKQSLDNRIVVKDEDDEIPLPPPIPILATDEEEPKPKPALRLRYNGFNIFGRCLCIVVEPWPPVRATPAPPNFPQSAFRTSSLTPSMASEIGAVVREQTPLFLPENDDRGRSETPALVPHNWRPPVPRFSDPPQEEDEDEGELLLFSQVLNATGESRMEADEEDDFAGADALFGDADEIKELD